MLLCVLHTCPCFWTNGFKCFPKNYVKLEKQAENIQIIISQYIYDDEIHDDKRREKHTGSMSLEPTFHACNLSTLTNRLKLSFMFFSSIYIVCCSFFLKKKNFSLGLPLRSISQLLHPITLSTSKSINSSTNFSEQHFFKVFESALLF